MTTVAGGGHSSVGSLEIQCQAVEGLINVAYALFADGKRMNAAAHAVSASGYPGRVERLYPYGKENASIGAKYLFTNQIRDAEGIDNFAMRIYASNLGRWLSPDSAGLAATDPSNPHGSPSRYRTSTFPAFMNFGTWASVDKTLRLLLFSAER